VPWHLLVLPLPLLLLVHLLVLEALLCPVLQRPAPVRLRGL
jgi:hypothetical protein